LYFSYINIFKLLELTENIVHKVGHEGQLWSHLSSSYIKMWKSPQFFPSFLLPRKYVYNPKPMEVKWLQVPK